jgi:hypothetical protein
MGLEPDQMATDWFTMVSRVGKPKTGASVDVDFV